MSIIRPTSDLALPVGATAFSPSTGTSLYATVDEVTADNTDYISATSAGQKARLALGTTTDPGNDNNHKLNYRAASPEGDRGVIAKVVQHSVPTIITSKQPWRRRPENNLTIDWNNPITRGMRHCLINRNGSLFDLVSNKFATLSGSPSFAYNEDKSVLKTVSASSQYAYIATSISGAPLTLISRHKENNGASAESVASFGTVSGIERIVIFYGAIANSYTASIIPNGSGDPVIACSTSGINTAGVSINTNTGYFDLVVNGISATSTVVAGLTNSLSRIYLSARCNSSVGVFGNISHTYTLAYNRVVGAYEQMLLHKEPWQIFKPKKGIKYFSGTKTIATRTPTLTASPADYSIDLTSGEAALITDYTKLAVEFEST